MEELLKRMYAWMLKRFDKERFVDVGSTTITANDQQYRIEASSVAFWNQGTTEVVVDNNYRLAPAHTDPTTGKLVGGEAYTYEDPTGRIMVHTFEFVFSDNTGTSGLPVVNKLVITTMKHVDQ